MRQRQCRKRNRSERSAGEEHALGPEYAPQRAGDDAGGQLRHPPHQIEHAEAGAAELLRYRVGDHRRQRALGQPHVQAPERDAEHHRRDAGLSAPHYAS